MDFFPLGGISNSRTIFCNETKNFVFYQSDRYGFNNNDKNHEEKKIDYFFVGDSFTHGACVKPENNIAGFIENLSKKKVLNFGYIGNGPLIKYATLREYIKKGYKNVVWFYYEDNDLQDLEKELKNSILRKYLNDENFLQNLNSKNNQKKIDNLLNDQIVAKISDDRVLLNKFLKFIKLFYTRYSIFHSSKETSQQIKNDNEIYNEYKIILEKTLNLSNQNGSNFIFVYLPEWSRFSSSEFDNTDYFKIKKIVNDLEIPFLDINEIMQSFENPLSFFPHELNAHYNEKGYKLVAEHILKNFN